jgi:hypothetical protein
MVNEQSHTITYSHPFAAVTSSLWHKYDHHKYVQNIEILDRHVDAEGRLHSTRLLSMGGSLPAVFRPFVPVKLVHMLETVVVDPQRQTMTVETSNINCQTVLRAYSCSRYTPAADAPESSTRYQIDIAVRAFPSDAGAPASRPSASGSCFSPDTVGVTLAAERDAGGGSKGGRDESEAVPAAPVRCDGGRSEWKMDIVAAGTPAGSLLTRLHAGYIAGKMESWVANKLLSNVSKGQSYIDGFCQRWHERHSVVCQSSHEHGDAGTHKASSSRHSDSAHAGGGHCEALGPRTTARVSGWARTQSCGQERGEEKGIGQGVRAAAARQLRFSRLLTQQYRRLRAAAP